MIDIITGNINTGGSASGENVSHTLITRTKNIDLVTDLKNDLANDT